MTNRMLLSVAALAAIVSYCFHRGRQVQVTQSQVKDELRRWEGEGGNVPQVATPSPAPPRYPDSGSNVRH